MKQIATALLASLLALAIIVVSGAFSVGAASTTYASDSFTRTLTGSWGSATTGGSYTLQGTSFSVNGAAGTMNIGSNATNSAYLSSAPALNIDVTFRVASSKLSAGGGQIAYFVGRRVSSGNDYLIRVRFPTDNTVWLEAGREVAGAATMLGTEAQVGTATHTAGGWIRVHAQLTGTNPTTIRIRAWNDGTSEPTSWQYSVTDSTSALQAAGGVGFRSYLSGAATNAPVLFYFDDLLVTDVTTVSPTNTPAPTVAPTNTPAPTVAPTNTSGTNKSLYWGALVQGLAPDSTNMATGGAFSTFEQHAGKKMSIIHWGQPWQMNGTMQAFQTSYFDNVRNHGSIPMLDWASWQLGYGVTQSNYQSIDIYNGAYDSYIRSWATAAKTWGHPFFLRFNWEMNGWWYPWGEGQTSTGAIVNGNQPGDFVKAWRHVHDIFVQSGATNVSWVWCPNMMASGSRYPSLSTVYPGDGYVDWTCLDGYNNYSSWLSFDQLFRGTGQTWLQNSYQNVLNVAPSKPMMIGETASLEAGDGGAKKAAWLTDVLKTQLISNYPQIKAFLYFNWNDGTASNTYPIESSSAAQNAFASGISLSNYKANGYSGLSTSPIPAP